jgi:hypothetical protein
MVLLCSNFCSTFISLRSYYCCYYYFLSLVISVKISVLLTLFSNFVVFTVWISFLFYRFWSTCLLHSFLYLLFLSNEGIRKVRAQWLPRLISNEIKFSAFLP